MAITICDLKHTSNDERKHIRALSLTIQIEYIRLYLLIGAKFKDLRYAFRMN